MEGLPLATTQNSQEERHQSGQKATLIARQCIRALSLFS